MYPILAQTGSLTFYTYGFVMMSTLFLIYFLAARNINTALLNLNHLSHISFLVVFSIWFGGMLFSLIFFEGFTLHNLHNYFNYQNFQQVGTLAITSTFIFTLFFYCLWQRLAFIKILDFLIPYFILGYALQRTFGCFFAGCCYGLPTHESWGVQFGNTFGVGPAIGLRVHPTQLYMGLTAFLTSLWMIKMAPRWQNIQGAMTGFGIMSLFGVYFLVSFYRGDLKWEWVYWGYDVSQIFSFTLFVLGLVMWSGTLFWTKQLAHSRKKIQE